MEAVFDETAIVSLQVQGKSGTNRKAKTKSGNQKGESKRVDLPTLRLRFATKILTQLRFMQASFRDLDGKISQFYTENAEIKNKASNLKSQGLPESRLISDTSLQLGDNAALVRLMYTVLDRHRLVQLLSVGSECMSLEGMQSDVQQDPDFATAAAKDLLKADTYLLESAPEAMAYVDYMHPEKMFEPLLDKQSIEHQDAEIHKTLKAVKACITAVRRSMSDFSQMVKSTTKAREKFEEQMARASNPKAHHGGLQGRPNLTSMAETDAEVLKHYKSLVSFSSF